ncbi:MAG: DUF6320 domain-containing protein [Oscillospiraceae bacterium]|jgi:hypothetical protein|nr:DUF6320 domain-containing protein [Oscillospiraceae bacterium]
MKCPDCQVDLNENVSRCPLCGKLAETSEPVIRDVSYQDYPAYEYRRFQRNLSLVYFCGSVAVFVALALLERLLTGRLHYLPYLAFLVPCVWALVIRPRMNRSLSPGNFLLGALFTISLLLFWVGRMQRLPMTSTLASGVAIVTLGAVSVLFLDTLVHKKNRERHLVFLLIFLVLGAAEFAAALREGHAHPAYVVLSACALGLSLINLIALGAFCGRALWEELRARFHF